MKGYNNAIDIQNINFQRLQDPVINAIAFPTNYEPLIDLMKSDIIQWVKEERYRRQLGLQIGEVIQTRADCLQSHLIMTEIL